MDAALHGDSVTALGQHGLRSRDKLARIPVKIVPMDGAALPKPPWLHAKPMMSETVAGMAAILREHRLHSVCEEAMCPNIGECFAQRTATFMIMEGSVRGAARFAMWRMVGPRRWIVKSRSDLLMQSPR